MEGSDLRQRILRRLGAHGFYGWVILSVAAIGVFSAGPSQSYTIGVFIVPLGRDLGISNTTIATIYGAATLVAASGSLIVGRLIDRFGTRPVLIVVASLLAATCFGFSQVHGVLGMAIGFTAFRFLGMGSTMLSCSNLVSQWFSRRRGHALSLMSLGFAVSMAVHPPLAQWLVETVGWRQAWVWLGVLIGVVLVPLVALFIHDRPEAVGLLPDGDARPASGETSAAAPPPAMAVAGLTLREALATRAFHIIVVATFFGSVLSSALHFHQVTILQAQGLDAAIAARMFPISALIMVLALPLIGRMLDRFPTRLVFAAGLLVTGASMAAISVADSVASAVVYAILFGLNNAAGLGLWSYLWPRYFGRRYLASIQGAGHTVGILGAAVGPVPLGIAFDLWGRYTEALWVLALLPALCAIAALTLKTPEGSARSGW